MCRCDIADALAGSTVGPGMGFSVLLMLLLCRVARMWNQTGDKWAHLSDVSDWLVRQVSTASIAHITSVFDDANVPFLSCHKCNRFSKFLTADKL